MRMLFLTPMLPVASWGGGTRPYNLVRRLATRHEVSILSFIRQAEQQLLPSLEPYCRRLEVIPFTSRGEVSAWRNRWQGWSRLLFERRPPYARTFPVHALRPVLRRLLDAQDYDVVVFDQLFLVELLDEVVAVPAVLCEQNVESDIARRACTGASHPVHRVRDWLAWQRLRAFERRWAARFDTCVVVSDRDAELLRKLCPAADVHVVPNGVDVGAFAPPVDSPADLAWPDATLLFFGALDYAPNGEGLTWFCEQVLPRVRAVRPSVRLEIVGRGAGPAILALGQRPGVTVTGFVEDVRPKLWSAALSVVPLLVGGGTRLKVLESLAAGCPVVSTTVGAEGLDLVNGHHLLIADTADAFAAEIVRLLNCDDLRHRLADAGLRAVAHRHDWDLIVHEFEAVCLATQQPVHGARCHR